MRLVLESTGVLTNRVLEGVALTPTVSANGNIYAEEEMNNAKNLQVPLRVDWEHSDEIIGNVIFNLNKKERRIDYRATITSEFRASQIKEGVHKVSIEADIEEVTPSCTRSRCYNLLSGIRFEGIAITENPSVSTTSLKIVESFQDWKPVYGVCESCGITSNITMENPSLNPNNITLNTMTEDTTKTVDTNTETKEMTCPEGEKEVFGKCVKVDETKAKETPCGCSKEASGSEKFPDTKPDNSWQANIDEINQRQKELKEMISSAKEIINATSDKVLSDLDKQVAEDKKQKEFNNSMYKMTKISSGPDGKGFSKEDIQYIAKEAVASLKKFRGYSYNIDMSPEYLESIKKRQVTEAISFSGNQSEISAKGTDIYVLPGGKVITPVRQYVMFDDIPDGSDAVLRAKVAIPNNGTITEGSATTASTHTVTTVSLAADTVTGVLQKVKLSDVEDTPWPVMSALNDTARKEVFESEATLLFDTAANAATPNLWINANSGATITHDDIASMTMEPIAYRMALQDLETSNYDTSFGNAFSMLHPKAMRELRGSTNLTTYIQQGDASITRTGQLTHLYGIELHTSTAVALKDNTTNDIYRNVVGIKNETFWLASHRDLRIDMLLTPVSSSIDWAWSQRKNATVFDPASLIRISSAQ